MAQDFLFFLGVLLMIFAVWVGAGGPNSPGAFSGPFLSGPGTATSTSWRGAVAGGDASPYRGQVTFSRDTLGAREEDERREYVVISASITNGESVSLAGWSLVSKASGESAILPSASLLPRAGRVNSEAPVSLAPGEQAIIVTGRSPIGTSFRENICTGYFEEHQDFAPGLALSCPTPSQEFSRFYDDNDEDGECIAAVRRIGQCTTETRSNVSGTCEDFIEERLSYDGCVASHQDDEDFAIGTWRLFLNERDELWKRERETILLLDANNEVVDALSY